LYGELLSGAQSDAVHHETIRERSQRHDWTIRLHRHSRLAQIFLFRTPGVRLRVDDVEHLSTESLLLLVPPQRVHGFRFPEDVRGDVLTLPMDLIAPDSAALVRQISDGAAALLPESQAPNFGHVVSAIRQSRQAFNTISPDRGAVLDALLRLVLLYIRSDMRGRVALAGTLNATELTRHESQAQAFCDAVEAHFAQPLTVADYAAMVGVSAPHLTRICRQVLGAPPHAVVRQRRIVEAKRLLDYTRHSVADIGFRAGFRDTAFFSRSFKAAVGQSPRAFRDRGGG
jgi:AraC family transcriptional activator of pobA